MQESFNTQGQIGQDDNITNTMSEAQFKRNDTYVYQLTDTVLKSLELLYFDGHLKEAQPPTPETSAEATVVSEAKAADAKVATSLHCNTCNIDLSEREAQRQHYQSELHACNIKRKFHGKAPLSEAELESSGTSEIAPQQQPERSVSPIREGAEDASGSDQENSSDSDKDDDDLYKTDTPSLVVATAEEEEDADAVARISHIANQTPFALFKSQLINNKNDVFGAYKALFNEEQIEDPLSTLTQWSQDVDATSGKFSAIFMIGGGHFAGAIVSHQRLSVKGNAKKQDVSQQEQAVLFLEHKTFHRYTTRRKQGGSQSTMDNAKGKANSAGSTLRRYNEAALKVDVQTLLKEWKPYLDRCENIFMRARSVQDRKIFLDEEILDKNDKRIKNLPFTTGRPTVGELKRAWCELAYLKITQRPKPIVVKATLPTPQPKKETNKQKQDEKKLSQEDKQTDEIVQLLKKGRAPLLIAYIRKNKIDKDFTLSPETKYGATPTMLHFAAQNGLKQMVMILLTNLKCSPCIKNANGKTAWDLAKIDTVKQAFQIARNTLGEDFTSWEDAHVAEPLSREAADEINLQAEEQEKKEAKEIVKKELQHVKERQQEDYEKKNGKGHKLTSTPIVPPISMEQNLNSLSDAQKMRLMREQRARAAEARMRQK